MSKINDVISTPSGYKTIVKCLQPRLVSNKLENAVFVCLDEKAWVRRVGLGNGGQVVFKITYQGRLHNQPRSRVIWR